MFVNFLYALFYRTLRNANASEAAIVSICSSIYGLCVVTKRVCCIIECCHAKYCEILWISNVLIPFIYLKTTLNRFACQSCFCGKHKEKYLVVNTELNKGTGSLNISYCKLTEAQNFYVEF